MDSEATLPATLQLWCNRDLAALDYYGYTTLLLAFVYLATAGICSLINIRRCKRAQSVDGSNENELRQESQRHVIDFLRSSIITALTLFLHANVINIVDWVVSSYALYLDVGGDSTTSFWQALLEIATVMAVAMCVIALTSLSQAVIFGWVCRLIARKGGNRDKFPYGSAEAKFISTGMLQAWCLGAYFATVWMPLTGSGISRGALLCLSFGSCWTWLWLVATAVCRIEWTPKECPYVVKALQWHVMPGSKVTDESHLEQQDLLLKPEAGIEEAAVAWNEKA
ncbi:hypothetical protein K431DRAFT_343841 [Polychaeton citri CBS 116435]|uniref:Uncharacterized protein n=1 Tax=Polychaeton citri CBS 116435 TaxID=1314669 RepID=A0A9P4US02_9PEZI|nr:hypothetical protein K431DRAFT_343841 [Polychaeton citri CBS 116435]